MCVCVCVCVCVCDIAKVSCSSLYAIIGTVIYSLFPVVTLSSNIKKNVCAVLFSLVIMY